MAIARPAIVESIGTGFASITPGDRSLVRGAVLARHDEQEVGHGIVTVHNGLVGRDFESFPFARGGPTRYLPGDYRAIFSKA